MALTPLSPRPDSQPRAPRRDARVGRGEAPAAPRALGGPVRRRLARLRVAVTDSEIMAQIDNLMRLLARGEIDRDAPRGTYLNILV